MNTLFGFSVSTLDREQTTNYILERIDAGEKTVREDLNAAKVIWCQKEGPVRAAVESASIINPDGQSVVWAANLLGIPVNERVTGIDLMQDLITKAACRNMTVYLLGAHTSTVTDLANKISDQYGREVMAGFSDGYFSIEEEGFVVQEINRCRPNMLFIGISSPKKEEFVLRNAGHLDVGLIMGVGGSFDVLAGKTSRAPLWMQRNGLEWFYRLVQEPKRMWKRYLVTNSKFIVITAKEFINRKFNQPQS